MQDHMTTVACQQAQDGTGFVDAYLESLELNSAALRDVATPESVLHSQALLRHARPNSAAVLRAVLSVMSPGVRVRLKRDQTKATLSRGMYVPRMAPTIQTFHVVVTFPADDWECRRHLLQSLTKEVIRWWQPTDAKNVTVECIGRKTDRDLYANFNLTVLCVDARIATATYPAAAVRAAGNDLVPRAVNLEPVRIPWSLEGESSSSQKLIRALCDTQFVRVFVTGAKAHIEPRFFVDGVNAVARRAWPLSPSFWEIKLPTPVTAGAQVKLSVHIEGHESDDLHLHVNPVVFRTLDDYGIGMLPQITRFTAGVDLRLIGNPLGSIQVPAWARSLPLGAGPLSFLARSACPTITGVRASHSHREKKHGVYSDQIDLEFAVSEETDTDEIAVSLEHILRPPLVRLSDDVGIECRHMNEKSLPREMMK